MGTTIIRAGYDGVSSVDGQIGAVGLAGRYVAHQATAPDPAVATAWADTSTTPPTMKGWNGTGWVAIGGGSGSTTVTASQITDASTVGRSVLTATSAAAARTTLGAPSTLTPTGTKTAAYTAVAGDMVLCDCTSAQITVTLPTAPADKTIIGAKKTDPGTDFGITLQTGGTDKFESSTATFGITRQWDTVAFQYDAPAGLWRPAQRYLTVASLNIPAALADLTGQVGYAQMPPGGTITVVWNDTNAQWQIGNQAVTTRPTSRTDLTVHFVGGTTAPTFGLAGIDNWDKDLA